jgi:hypothetical protein
MYELMNDGQINKTEIVGNATVGTHYTWGTHIIATYQEGVLRAEYRKPIIEETEWQGQLIETEQRLMSLRVDDSEPITLDVVNGVAEHPITFETPGTYQLEVNCLLTPEILGEETIYHQEFGCVPSFLEVVIDDTAI